jgi:type VI protein secretion system component VasK
MGSAGLMLNLSQDSPVRSRVLVILIAVIVSVVGIAFDRMLVREGVPRWDLMAMSNTLTGIVAGAFFWQARRRERERRQFVRERLRTISEMNHHIRNALQVISYYSEKQQDQKVVETLGQAVNRIEWALSEVLPAELTGGPIPNPLPSDIDPRIVRR